MKDMAKTASRLDVLLRILGIAVDIAAVCHIVALGIIAAAFLFDLPPAMVGTGWDAAEFEFLTIHIADKFLPDFSLILGSVAVESFFLLLCLLPARMIVKCLRNILSPIKDGTPFHSTVSTNLKKMANYVCSLGISINCRNITANSLLVSAYDLSSLLLSEKITQVDFEFAFDFSFLLVWGILLLLSYVFHYGEELQQLSDETL